MNLNGKLKKILEAGTTKQKAITYCFEMLEEELDPTDKMAVEILDSIPEKERSTFFKWVYYFNVYLYMTPYFGLAFAEYRAEAFKAINILNRIEQYRHEEKRLNDMIQAADEDQRNNLIAVAIDDRNDGTVRKEEPAGVVKIEPEQLKKDIFDAIDLVKFTLSGLKAVIEAMEEWGTIRRCKDIQPRRQVRSIAEVKRGYITDTAFPRYEDIVSDKTIKAFAAEKLFYYERTIRRDAIWNAALKEAKKKKDEKDKKNKK